MCIIKLIDSNLRFCSYLPKRKLLRWLGAQAKDILCKILVAALCSNKQVAYGLWYNKLTNTAFVFHQVQYNRS